MARKITENVLNASTIDILNVIRANASIEYQSAIPNVTTEHDIIKVGDVLYGHPGLANQFLNALVNRIAFVRIQSATFNNPYRGLKKGFLSTGETVEEVFVNLARGRVYNPEKAPARELARSLPDVRAAFHPINWRVYYPVTIQNEDLRQAFVSYAGVEDLIARIIESVYTAAEYDEYLLFKYLIIKAVTKGQMAPVSVAAGDTNSAIAFRGYSNALTLMSGEYNTAGVQTTTPRDRQYLFMDAKYNATYDVNVLASAFNMDKADFMGHVVLIDSWTTFDNERFSYITAESDGLEEVTAAELTLMGNVKAVLVDSEFFQVYDALATMTEKYVSNGLYWNYFYHSWKVVSTSPFSNAIAFIDSSVSLTAPASITAKVVEKSVDDYGVNIFTIQPFIGTTQLATTSYEFVQDQANTAAGVAIQKYGVVIVPKSATPGKLTINYAGNAYTTSAAFAITSKPGDTLTFTK